MRYICDHADECESTICAGKGYLSENDNWHNIYRDGFKQPNPGLERLCKYKTVYFISYFEYLMLKKLKENKNGQPKIR